MLMLEELVMARLDARTRLDKRVLQETMSGHALQRDL